MGKKIHRSLLSFTAYGNPTALKRHRPRKFGGNYDPSSGDKADFLAKCMEYRPDTPYDIPLRLHLLFVFQRPKAHYRTGKYSKLLKDNAPKAHTSKPDLDNLVKFVCDALNGIFWKDDSVIFSLIVEKEYGESPRIDLELDGEVEI